jgi:hypothetical protein
VVGAGEGVKDNGVVANISISLGACGVKGV